MTICYIVTMSKAFVIIDLLSVQVLQMLYHTGVISIIDSEQKIIH